MKSLFKIVLSIVVVTSIFSCQQTDDVTAPPARPYAEVYPEDTLKIRQFMETHYITVDADYNTTFTQIPAGGTQQPISDMAELESVERDFHDIKYKIYYLKLREGIGETTTRLDSAFVSYKGNTFAKTTTDGVDTYTQNIFDQSDTPVWFSLEDVIKGWGEIIPEFKTGTHIVNQDGTISFDNYGAGVMFLPSGLGYFNTASGNISSYSPLIFNFKLYKQHARDHDQDRILSKYEYGQPELDGVVDHVNGKINYNKTALDTDDDGIPDYLDIDDDGDGFLTKFEIKKPVPLLPNQGTSLYYPFHPITDNPTTSQNEEEPKGIPSKELLNGSPDGATLSRLRRHLDKTSKPPFTIY
jgi:FKBP-type peptidyl-prolyl cis-trans isomerase FkpA